MTTKFDNFKAALEALCEEHGVMLDAGNENLIVWDNPYNPNDKFCNEDMYLQDETGSWELNFGMDAEG